MGWFSKIFNSSKHKVVEGQYDKRNGANSVDNHPYNSYDAIGETDDIDHAIALSLVQAEQEGKKLVDFDSQVNEDEQLAIALQESLVCLSPPSNGKSIDTVNGHEQGQGQKQRQRQRQQGKVQGQGQGNGQVHGHGYGHAHGHEHVHGHGHGQWFGHGYGNGYGNGHGNGYGNGYGNGHGNGYGNGYGHGYGGGNMYQQPMPFSWWSTGVRLCAGCNTQIVHGRFLSCMGADWHPECFRCRACNQPISDNEFSTYENYPHHKACYRQHCYPKCDVCKQLIPINSSGFIEYRAHPFWSQKYCPAHEHDGTHRCCSCERLEPRDMQYATLDDGRKLCLECLDSAIMGTNECQPLYIDIQEFYENLNMKVEQQVPLLLVERQALNEALGGEKHGHHHMPETRGLCLSEEQIVNTVAKRPRMGTGNRAVDMRTEQYKLTRRCEVTAILILYGLPRLLTGSILAHEMMHAWLRLRGYRNLSQEVEEGICQVLAHMWLESQGVSSIPQNNAPSSSSSHASRYSNQKSQSSTFISKLGEFFKHQIEADTSPIYGNGYRAAKQAVVRYGLERTLDHMHMTGTFPY